MRAVAKLAQAFQLFITPIVVNRKERCCGKGNVVVKDLGALDGIRNDLEILSRDSCLQESKLYHIKSLVIGKGIGCRFASVRVYLLADQRCILGGRNAHDQLFALLLCKQRVLQVIIMEQLKSAMNEAQFYHFGFLH